MLSVAEEKHVSYKMQRSRSNGTLTQKFRSEYIYLIQV